MDFNPKKKNCIFLKKLEKTGGRWIFFHSIIWNIRAIGKAPTVRRLKKLIHMHRLSLICVLVPFLHLDKLESTRNRLGIESAISSSSRKIWVFWLVSFTLEVIQDARQVLHCRVSHSFFPDPVFVSLVYAFFFISL